MYKSLLVGAYYLVFCGVLRSVACGGPHTCESPAADFGLFAPTRALEKEDGGGLIFAPIKVAHRANGGGPAACGAKVIFRLAFLQGYRNAAIPIETFLEGVAVVVLM